jgi:hypothetical protein
MTILGGPMGAKRGFFGPMGALFTNRSNKRRYWAYVSKTRAAYWSKGCKKKACRGAKRKPTGPWKFTKKTFRPTKRKLRSPIIPKFELSTLTGAKRHLISNGSKKGSRAKLAFRTKGKKRAGW